MNKKSAWEKYDEKTLESVMSYAENYMDFLDRKAHV